MQSPAALFPRVRHWEFCVWQETFSAWLDDALIAVSTSSNPMCIFRARQLTKHYCYIAILTSFERVKNFDCGQCLSTDLKFLYVILFSPEIGMWGMRRYEADDWRDSMLCRASVAFGNRVWGNETIMGFLKTGVFHHWVPIGRAIHHEVNL